MSENPVVYSTDFATAGDVSSWLSWFFSSTYANLVRDTSFKRPGFVSSMRVDPLQDDDSDGIADLGRAYKGFDIDLTKRYRMTAWVWLSANVEEFYFTSFFDAGAFGFDGYGSHFGRPVPTEQWIQVAVEGVPSGDFFVSPEFVAKGDYPVFWVQSVVLYEVPGAGEIVAPRRSLDEVVLGSGRCFARVTLLSGPGEGEILPVTHGTIRVEDYADITRSGTITVVGLPEWEPRDATDVLDIRSGTEMLLEQGVVDDDGVKHWWSQGVFRPSSPSVVRNNRGISITCAIHDRGYSVKLASIRRRWVIGAQDPILGSIIEVLYEVAPWLPIDIDLSDDYPSGDDIVVVEYGDDVWKAVRELALSMSRRLHVNREGVLVAPHIVDTYEVDPSPLPPLLSLDITSDTAQIVNVVGATWTEARPDDAPDDWVPDGGIEEWVDEVSSTSVNSEVGVRARAYSGDSSVLHTAYHAMEAARADGLRLRDLSLAATCDVIPDPRLDIGGIASITLSDLSLENTDIPITWDGFTTTWDSQPMTWGELLSILTSPAYQDLRFRITGLTIDLAGLEPTAVTLGAPHPDLASLVGQALSAPKERQEIEIVASTDPLRTRALHDKQGSEVIVRPSGCLANAMIGDRVIVNHKGRGERVGVSTLLCSHDPGSG